MKKYISASLFAFILSFSFAFAEISTTNVSVLQSFKQFISIPRIEILVPTVVEIPVPEEVYGSHFAVYNQTEDRFEPYVLTQNSLLKKGFSLTVPTIISAGNSPQNAFLFDNDFQTFTQFDVNDEGEGYAEIQYSFEESVRSTSLQLSLEQYVSLPNLITIKTIENGQEKIIVSKIRPGSNNVNFPETSSKEWKIELTFSQPLRINELQIINLNSKKIPTSIRFLAQPEKDYKIYTDPDSVISQKIGERPNLSSNKDIKIIQPFQGVEENSLYKLADTDGDTVADVYDNCVLISNTEQEDLDKNDRGDACDDFDKDGVINSEDNCINDPNVNQQDIDNDLIGDVCDGIESRLTERNPWIVWGGIIFAALLFLGLFAVALRKIRLNRNEVPENSQI